MPLVGGLGGCLWVCARLNDLRDSSSVLSGAAFRRVSERSAGAGEGFWHGWLPSQWVGSWVRRAGHFSKHCKTAIREACTLVRLREEVSSSRASAPICGPAVLAPDGREVHPVRAAGLMTFHAVLWSSGMGPFSWVAADWLQSASA